MNLKHALFTAALLALGAGSAQAGSANANFETNVNVIADCSIAVDDLQFPDVGLLNNNVDGSTQMHIQCTGAIPYNITLADTSGSGQFILRRAGGGQIQYAFYQDASRSVVWDTTSPLSGTSNGAQETLTVYARIAPQPSQPMGAYNTTNQAVINF